MGMTSVTVTSGGAETVLITVGKSATASGRIIFEGSGRPAASPGSLQLPLMSVEGRRCNAGRIAIAPDWSFTVDGLMGTCTTHMYQAGRWMVKSVIYNGEDLLDLPITFTPGSDYHDLQVVMTDRRSDVAFAVTAAGRPTREYVAVVIPASRARWAPMPGPDVARVYLPPPVTVLEDMRATPGTAADRTDTPARREVMQGLRPGEYLAVALDNVEWEDLRDPAVLEKLASAGTKLVVGDAARVEVSLNRITFAEFMR
jgi:hypothetical protein